MRFARKRGLRPPFQNPPLCRDVWSASGASLRGSSQVVGDGITDSHTRAKPLLAATPTPVSEEGR